jgi:hypothetical protein
MGRWEKLKCINREYDITANYANKITPINAKILAKISDQLAKISGENKIELEPLVKNYL